jgi:hypothetical protein
MEIEDERSKIKNGGCTITPTSINCIFMVQLGLPQDYGVFVVISVY